MLGQRIAVLIRSLRENDRPDEVLRLMCRHLSGQEIAAELFISEKLVKAHKASMPEKPDSQQRLS